MGRGADKYENISLLYPSFYSGPGEVAADGVSLAVEVAVEGLVHPGLVIVEADALVVMFVEDRAVGVADVIAPAQEG